MSPPSHIIARRSITTRTFESASLSRTYRSREVCDTLPRRACRSSSRYWIEVSSMSVLFFFSSRRRHTRSDRDWSSDVCSSDLAVLLRKLGAEGKRDLDAAGLHLLQHCTDVGHGALAGEALPRAGLESGIRGDEEIGRASCRERV